MTDLLWICLFFLLYHVSVWLKNESLNLHFEQFSHTCTSKYLKNTEKKKQNCIFTVKLILYCNLATKLLNIFPREFRAMVVWVPYFSFFCVSVFGSKQLQCMVQIPFRIFCWINFKNEEFRFWLKHNLQSWAWKQSWHVFTIFIISLRSLTFMLCGLAFIHIVVF